MKNSTVRQPAILFKYEDYQNDPEKTVNGIKRDIYRMSEQEEYVNGTVVCLRQGETEPSYDSEGAYISIGSEGGILVDTANEADNFDLPAQAASFLAEKMTENIRMEMDGKDLANALSELETDEMAL